MTVIQIISVISRVRVPECVYPSACTCAMRTLFLPSREVGILSGTILDRKIRRVER